MDVKKPTRFSLSAQIVQEMERILRNGHQWKVGDKIPSEPELMQLFEVSRNTVREAVQSLIHTGLLTAKPGDGTYVTGRSRLEIILHRELADSEPAKIIEARLALESGIAALAAVNRTEEDLAGLERLLKLRNQSDDLVSDTNFHIAVAQAAHNPLLTNFYQEICLFMAKNLVQKMADEDVHRQEIDLHNLLFQALHDSDPEQAKDVTYDIVQFYGLRLGHPSL